ncbi:MAG: EamA family transporter [Granulosicoccus sp.]
MSDAQVNMRTGNLVCMCAVALFALTFPVAELLLEKWGALTLIAVRNVLGFLILFLAYCYFYGIKQVLSAPWRAGAFIGALGFGVGSTLLLIAQSHTNAVTAALAAAMMPLAGVGLEMLLDGRRMTRNFLLGTVLVLLGSMLAIGMKVADVTFGVGALMGVASTIVFAWGSRATVKVLEGSSDLTRTVVTTAGMALFSLIAFMSFSLLNVGTAQMSFVRPTMVDWGLIVVYAGFALALSQIMWIKGVSKIGIGIASFHLNAAPFYVMLILLGLGGGWDWQQASGAAVLALGVVLAQR